jgi:maleylacetoacetate isomerase
VAVRFSRERAGVAAAAFVLHDAAMAAPFTLYSFFQSSASFRVRIALHLKGIPYEYVAVHIGRQESDAFAKYRAMNPQALVPALVHGDVTLNQSLAILEYLEEVAPSPALLPKDAAERARVRSIAQYIVSEIQPMQNLRVQRHLQSAYSKTEEEAMEWRRHWVGLGLDALEKQLSERATGAFCHGDSPTMADCCLVPQFYSSQRWGLDMAKWPTIRRITENADRLEAFQRAAADKQPDAPPKAN